MEEEELYADFKKHLNVDFGEEYEDENLRNSIPKNNEHEEEANYVEDNLDEQLSGFQNEYYD